MYLVGTAHGTFIGTDSNQNLVQIQLSNENLPSMVFVEKDENNNLIIPRIMADFDIDMSQEGISFVKNKKYLCALPGSTTMVVNRDSQGPWETFVLLKHEDVPDIEMERFRQAVLKLQAEGKPVKIYCGAGTVPRPGFLNLDITCMSPRFLKNNPDEFFIFPFVDRKWDIPNDCIDYIFHEDFIEHLPQLKQIQFLAESLRVMKPGSWHRVNTPNIITAMKKYSNFKEGFRGVYTGEEKHGHIAIFSPLSLKEMSELIGYKEIIFTTRHHGVSPYAEKDFRPAGDRDAILGNIYADLLK